MPCDGGHDMKPFDLKEALAGKPVVARGGMKVVHIMYDPGAPESRRVYGRYENGGYDWHYENGRCRSSEESQADLFMATVKQKYWLNVYPGIVCHRYTHLDAANRAALSTRLCCVQIEIEE